MWLARLRHFYTSEILCFTTEAVAMAAPGTTTELGVTHLAAESVSGQTNVSLASRGSFAKVASLCLNSTCQETIATMMEMSGKDASWILTSAVIIFTMQTGALNMYAHKALGYYPG